MNDDDRDGDVSDLLEAFFEAMHRAAEEGDVSGHGRVGDGSTRIDFDYTVRTGTGPGADGRRGHPRFGGGHDADRTGIRNPAGPAGDSDRGGKSADRPVHVDTTGEDRTVTVDMVDSPVEDAADVEAVVDSGVVAVRFGGETVATAPLDGDGSWTVADVAVNNGVLRVEIEDA